MPRPDRSAERREELLPVVAAAFAELGYRRTSTAELAERCDVRVNVLYRLWPDKKAMFVAAIHHVFERSLQTWEARLARLEDPADGATELLAYEARHLGEHGLYRILFAGLGETDDAEIKTALAQTYARFVAFIRGQVAAHRGTSPQGGRSNADVDLAVWAILGLGTVANIGRELGLLSSARRARLLSEMGEVVLES
ncbi:MAG: TetR/AcrR family transcriptional regulator [Planctomycetota bacterium]|jgi:AcrR family transcriptional regulator